MLVDCFHFSSISCLFSRSAINSFKKTKPISLLRILLNECARRRRDCLFCLPAALSFFSNENVSLKRRGARQPFPFQQLSSFSIAHRGRMKRRVAEWTCRAAGLLGAPFAFFIQQQATPFLHSMNKFISFRNWLVASFISSFIIELPSFLSIPFGLFVFVRSLSRSAMAGHGP